MFSQGLTGMGGYSDTPDSQMSPGKSADPSKKARPTSEQSLLPVTIKMVDHAFNNRVGNEMVIHGREAGTIVVVGAIEDLVKQQAAAEFVLNDATARIQARFFFPSADYQLTGIEQGSYVSAVGTVKAEPKLHLSIVALRAVQSPDEIPYHAIEAAHAAFKLRRKAEGKSELSTVTMDVDPVKVPTPTRAPTQVIPPPMSSNTVLKAGAPEAAKATAPMNLQLTGNQLAESIQSFMQRMAENRPEGLTVDDVCSNLGASATRKDVEASIQQLVDDGAVFTTIDENHFLCV